MNKLILAFIILLSIKAEAQIIITKAIVPQYTQGVTPTNNNRTSLLFWAELSGLTPSATYNFYTTIDTLNASSTSNGVGNPILINMANASIRRTTNASLSSVGGYDSLVTDTSGVFAGWFGVEPTGNGRFTPGNTIYPKIILNNGNGGITTATRLMLTDYPIKIINYGSTAGSSIQGSAVYDSIPVAAKSFVCLYNDTTSNPQTDRPIAIAIVENDELDVSQLSSSPNFYKTIVDGKNHYWGAIIPNDLASGVNRIEALKFANAEALLPIYKTKKNDGVWCGVLTQNSSNSTTAMYLKASIITPVVNITASQDTACEKTQIILSATGATNFTWSSGTTTVSDTVIATRNVGYSVIGTDSYGCTGIDSIEIVVDSLPTVYGGGDVYTCGPGSVILIGQGNAQTYSWNKNVIDSTAFIQNVTDTFIVTGTGVNTCINTDTVVIFVYTIPSVSFHLPLDTVCNSMTAYTLTGGSPSGGTYLMNSNIVTTFDPSTTSLGGHELIYVYVSTDGCGNRDTASIYVDVCTNLNGITNKKTVEIYPNPSNGKINVHLNETDKNVYTEVYTLTGQLITREKMQRAVNTIDLSNKPDGIYLLRILNAEGIISQSKIVIQK